MRLAQRVQQLPPYLFARISELIATKRAAGVDVISLGIGDPDIPTPSYLIDVLKQSADRPANHRYPESDGLPEFRQAIARWYESRHGVTLDPNREVVPLIGSKEGIGHLPLCLIDPGDVSLITDPGYPVYEIGTMFAGGETVKLPLREEDGWLPRLDEIPVEAARRARILWLNYPNNPTGAVADRAFFEHAVAWAKAHDVVIAHDLAYADVAYDGYRPSSILEVPGAIDVAIEFNSLSKAFNMTGWRVGMAVGNATVINALTRVKTNLDSGIPQAIQEMAIAALDDPRDTMEVHNAIYQRRRDRAVAVLRELGLRVDPPKASLYVWARLPEGERSSAAFAAALIEATGVVVTPGMSYGQAGEGYIRISLTVPDDRLEEALNRLSAFARGEKVL
ncbi:MAG: LL-diaminopimelate aminotransferase [Dehalococcoidia bacterium]